MDKYGKNMKYKFVLYCFLLGGIWKSDIQKNTSYLHSDCLDVVEPLSERCRNVVGTLLERSLTLIEVCFRVVCYYWQTLANLYTSSQINFLITSRTEYWNVKIIIDEQKCLRQHICFDTRSISSKFKVETVTLFYSYCEYPDRGIQTPTFFTTTDPFESN